MSIDQAVGNDQWDIGAVNFVSKIRDRSSSFLGWETCWPHRTMVENGKKHRFNRHPIIHSPTSEGVSEVSERANKRTDEVRGPVLQCVFLAVLDQSASLISSRSQECQKPRMRGQLQFACSVGDKKSLIMELGHN